MTRIGQETRIELGRRELFSLCAGSPQVLHCLSGEVWITFDGRQDDLILQAGQQIELSGQAGIVLSALQAATVSLSATVGCRLAEPPSIATAARRLRWRFPELASFPAAAIARRPHSTLPPEELTQHGYPLRLECASRGRRFLCFRPLLCRERPARHRA